MVRRQLLYLLYTSSARPPSATPYFTAPPPPPPHFLFRKGYSRENHAADETISHERAPSTLEEFKRLEEEKANEGVVSQTVDHKQAKDGVMDAATGKGDVESVKESFKKVAGDGDVGNTGDFQSTK